jgi:hypothetical protein
MHICKSIVTYGGGMSEFREDAGREQCFLLAIVMVFSTSRVDLWLPPAFRDKALSLDWTIRPHHRHTVTKLQTLIFGVCVI